MLPLLGLALVAIGLPSTAIGATITLLSLGSFRRRRRLVRTQVTPIAAVRSGPAAIRGKIVVEEDGTFPAPFCVKPAVWLRLEAQSRLSSRNLLPTGWGIALEAVHAVAFLVDDSSGVRARVLVDGAQVIFPTKDTEALPVFDGLPADAAVLFEQHAAARWKKFMTDGIVVARRYREQFLSPGDEVVVVGMAESPGGAGGVYRSGDGSLVTFRKSPREPDLFITPGEQGEIEGSVGAPFGCAVAAFALGLIGTVVGALLILL